MRGVPKIKTFLLALVIVVGLIFLNLPNTSEKVKNFFFLLSAPIQKTFYKFVKKIEESWKFLNLLRKISKENLELQEEIKELTAQNTKLKELKEENEFLRSRLNLPQSENYQIELSTIVGRDFQGLEKYILINKGSVNNIKKNMPVVVFDNILVGKVVEVFESFSKVLLISSSNSKIPALIQESRIEGLVKGKHGNVLSLNLIPKNMEVEKGQTVITSGIEGIFPAGLFIGRISSVEILENEMFQKIEIVPPINIERLERVFVIKNF